MWFFLANRVRLSLRPKNPKKCVSQLPFFHQPLFSLRTYICTKKRHIRNNLTMPHYENTWLEMFPRTSRLSLIFQYIQSLFIPYYFSIEFPACFKYKAINKWNLDISHALEKLHATFSSSYCCYRHFIWKVFGL